MGRSFRCADGGSTSPRSKDAPPTARGTCAFECRQSWRHLWRDAKKTTVSQAARVHQGRWAPADQDPAPTKHVRLEAEQRFPRCVKVLGLVGLVQPSKQLWVRGPEMS